MILEIAKIAGRRKTPLPNSPELRNKKLVYQTDLYRMANSKRLAALGNNAHNLGFRNQLPVNFSFAPHSLNT